MLSLWIYIRSFFTVVVVSCSHPVNWEQCVRVDQWLLPEVKEGYRLWTGEVTPYEKERIYLNRGVEP
ncbi:MAG: hypothetical protein CML44_00805 [Rhodobacteraceae bacterium]|nr:hypothetical protein [Paracoccaceae bacterium]